MGEQRIVRTGVRVTGCRDYGNVFKRFEQLQPLPGPAVAREAAFASHIDNTTARAAILEEAKDRMRKRRACRTRRCIGARKLSPIVKPPRLVDCDGSVGRNADEARDTG